MMVASRVVHDLSKFDTYCTRTETLSEWITTVRYKKGAIRRQKKNRDLRVAAVLTTALQRAEMELRRKQSERAQKWAQVRAQYEGESHKEENQWNDASWNVREGHPCNNNSEGDDDVTNVTGQEEQVAKLWTRELVGLDNLFNDLNQIKTLVAR